MFNKKKPIGSFIYKIKEIKVNSKGAKENVDENGTVRIRISNQLNSNNNASSSSENQRTVTPSSSSKFSSFLHKQRQMPFQQRKDRVREQFINSKNLLIKKLSRSTGNLSTTADSSGGSSSAHKTKISPDSKEKSKSLNENHLLPPAATSAATSSPSKKPTSKQNRRQQIYNQNNLPYRPQNNKYRKLRTTPRIPTILGQFAEYQHNDTNNSGGVEVINHMVKWAPNEGAQTDDFIGCRRCKYQEESDDDGSDDIFVGDDDDEDESCTSSSGKCSSPILNNTDNSNYVDHDDKAAIINNHTDDDKTPDINKIIEEADEIDKQIWHEIQLLDKTLEEYSK